MRLRRTPISAALAAFAGMLATPSFGQWPSHPVRGIPRLPDGTPNLTAPTPRTADGKPDLSGMWQVDGSGSVNGLALNVAQDLKPEDIQPLAQSLYQERLLNLGKDSPMARCLPRGLPALNSFPGVLTRIVQAPGLIVILFIWQTRPIPFEPSSWMAASFLKLPILLGWSTRLAGGRGTRWW